MLTNQISVTYNMRNIDADFDIFRVEKANKDYYKYNILDSAVYDFKAAAVQWAFGATALVLFHKGEVTEQQFKESIMNEYKDVKIQKIDVLDSGQCEKYFYYKNRLLAQLLLNSMRTPRYDKFKYNNLTGKLFYHDPSWILKDKMTKQVNYIRFLEVVIDPGMYLNLEQKTFKRCKNETTGGYVIDSGTGEFRKKLKTDVNVVTYKEGSMPNNHFKIDNFNIKSYAAFRKCKIGVLERFLRDVQETLSDYLAIEILERENAREYEISRLEKKGITTQQYGKMLQKKGVVIVDDSGSEKAEEMVLQLQMELKKYYDVEAKRGKLSKTAYNIRIIHEEKYYSSNEMYDPHSDDLKGYIVQHMTEEAEHFTNKKGSSPDIKKIVQELIIKEEVREKQISIFDWKKLDSGKSWTFVLRKKIKADLNENTDSSNQVIKKKVYYFKYYRLKIDHNGQMEFDTFCDRDQNETEEWNKICYAYDFAENKHWGVRDRVEGLVYSDIDNIQVILLTREKTLPNPGAFMDTLKETDEKEKVSKEVLLNAMDDFSTTFPTYLKNVLEWKAKLSEETDMITKKNIKKILNMKTKAAFMFNRFLHENYNIWIYGELRNAEFESIFQISNLLNIKFEYISNDYLDGNTFVYYVGAKSKKISYPNACCMRKVITVGNCLEYEELLPLMAVEFVRNGQYTVLPFPYKYLREYMVQCE